MKKLLILLFSIFFLISSSVFADDLSNFTIDGISIGDSLLDYMTEDEILEGIERTNDDYYFLKEPNKYAEVYLHKNLNIYEGASFFVKNTPTSEYITNKYIILSIRGLIGYNEDFDGCIQQRDEVAIELSRLFPNAQKLEGILEYVGDPSGNSIIDAVYYEFDSGAQSEASCYDYEETFRIKNNWSDNLSVAIDTAEIVSWLNDY